MHGLGLLIVAGVLAQVAAWRLRLPSILVLLLTGFALGPGLGWIRPQEIFGAALFPIVSLSVALILFEGGLSLRFGELKGGGVRATLGLVVIGAPVAWALATWAARRFLGMAPGTSLILGAILIVTGPTVIGPLLAHVRPSGRTGPILRWEGIVNDPIGAVIAVLAFQGLVALEHGNAGTEVALGALAAVTVGLCFGGLAAALLVVALRRFLVADHLVSPLALALALAAFVGSDAVMHESGLLAVTLMGMLLANQRIVAVEEIVAFKENLRVLLIATLFLLLSARVSRETLLDLVDPSALMFVAALILVVRPLTVLASTLGSGLTWRETAFLSFLAPRGIVAAAVSSVFGLELAREGIPEGERLSSVVLLVIVATVAIYGLSAGPLARALGLSLRRRDGVLFFGANPVARAVARALRDAGVPVLLVETDRDDVQRARLEGLDARHVSVFAERLRAELGPFGRLCALSWSDSANTLAVQELVPIFGRRRVYQVQAAVEPGVEDLVPHHRGGRLLFAKGITLWDLAQRMHAGAVVKRTPITSAFDAGRFREVYGEAAIPLFLVRDGEPRAFTADDEMVPEPGDVLIHLSRDVEPRGSDRGWDARSGTTPASRKLQR